MLPLHRPFIESRLKGSHIWSSNLARTTKSCLWCVTCEHVDELTTKWTAPKKAELLIIPLTIIYMAWRDETVIFVVVMCKIIKRGVFWEHLINSLAPRRFQLRLWAMRGAEVCTSSLSNRKETVQGLERRRLAESREGETCTHMALPSEMSFTSHYKGWFYSWGLLIIKITDKDTKSPSLYSRFFFK